MPSPFSNLGCSELGQAIGAEGVTEYVVGPGEAGNDSNLLFRLLLFKPCLFAAKYPADCIELPTPFGNAIFDAFDGQPSLERVIDRNEPAPASLGFGPGDLDNIIMDLFRFQAPRF